MLCDSEPSANRREGNLHRRHKFTTDSKVVCFQSKNTPVLPIAHDRMGISSPLARSKELQY